MNYLKNDALCHLASLVVNEPKELEIKNNNHVPEIFYVGNGKTGSSSLMKGFDKTVAHWHDEFHFESLYSIKGFFNKNNICLYDLVKYFGDTYHFKPLLIESYRDPIARAISDIGQKVFSKKIIVNNKEEFFEQLDIEFILNKIPPYSLKWKDYFRVDILEDFDSHKGWLFKNLDSIKLLFIRLEDSDNWGSILENLGFSYKDVVSNSSKNRFYAEIYKAVLSDFYMSTDDLNKIYTNHILKSFYTDDEIVKFIKRWSFN